MIATRLIETSGLTMRFPGAPTPLFEGVDLRVDRGEVVPLLGGNGVGKTTLLRLLCGGVLPSAGEVSVGGVSMTTRTNVAQRLVGVSLYPERSFYYRLTCEQNLRYFASLRGLLGRQASAEVARALVETGLDDQAKVAFMRLSLGQRKRLGLSRALLGRPPVLVLDEPTANLDTESVSAFWRIFAVHAATGGCVVFSTHQLQDLRVATGRHLTIEGSRLRSSSSVLAGAAVRRVEVWAQDLDQVDLTDLQVRWGLEVGADRLTMQVPVTVPLADVLARLSGSGVVVEQVRDDPYGAVPGIGAPSSAEAVPA